MSHSHPNIFKTTREVLLTTKDTQLLHLAAKLLTLVRSKDPHLRCSSLTINCHLLTLIKDQMWQINLAVMRLPTQQQEQHRDQVSRL